MIKHHKALDVLAWFWVLLVFVMLAAWWGGPHVYGQDKVRLEASPRFFNVPASVKLRIWVEPSADNREICYGIFGLEEVGSCRQMDGDKAPRYYEITYLVRERGPAVASVELSGPGGVVRVRQSVDLCGVAQPEDAELCFAR